MLWCVWKYCLEKDPIPNAGIQHSGGVLKLRVRPASIEAIGKTSFDALRVYCYAFPMDLLRRAELPAWLLKEYGSARGLATALGVTRQTAHNLTSGRTIPSYDNCERLGLDPVFLLTKPEERRTMNTLDEFLAKRNQNRHEATVASATAARRLSEEGLAAWEGLLESIKATAGRVGKLDGEALEWNSFPFLKLKHVAASFTPLTLGPSPECRVIFGRIPTAMYIDDNPLSTDVWELKLSFHGARLLWNVNAQEMVGVPSPDLAEQVVKRLIEYSDDYQAACARAWGGAA